MLSNGHCLKRLAKAECPQSCTFLIAMTLKIGRKGLAGSQSLPQVPADHCFLAACLEH